jgi:predicted enzyme related to lactoylglutathione lyase
MSEDSRRGISRRTFLETGSALLASVATQASHAQQSPNNPTSKRRTNMARVTGIGGVFLKAKDPKALSAWYAEHLAIKLASYGGAKFSWSDEVPATTGSTAWMIFPATTKHFGPSGQTAMVNYRVDDLDGILAQITAGGGTVDPDRQEAPFGKFAWATDPEGNKFELWQPLVPAK